MADLPADNHPVLREDLELVLRQAAGDLQGLRGASLFLTGCTGFLGRWLLEALLYADERLGLDLRLSVLTRDAPRFLRAAPYLADRPHLRLVQGDILSFSAGDSASFDYLVHGANLPNDASPGWAARHMTAAALGTERLFRLAARGGCRGVLLFSSGAVYGVQSPQPVPFREDGLACSLAEPSIYGNTKRFLELYALALGERAGVRVSIARCFSFLGAHLPLTAAGVLGSFVASALRGEDIVIRSDGKAVRSYLYGTDLVIWLLALLLRGGSAAYNVGSERAVSLRELADLVAACRGGGRVAVLGRPTGGNAPKYYVPDTSKVRGELGLRETVSLEEGLRRLFLWGYEHGLDNS